MEKKASAEKAIREIRRKTRRRCSAEEKIRGRCWSMHPNEARHRIAAQAMEQFIRENYRRSQ